MGIENKIKLIKDIRAAYGFDLKTAKDIVEEANCDSFRASRLAKRHLRKLSANSLEDSAYYAPQESSVVSYEHSDILYEMDDSHSPFNNLPE